MTDCAIIAKYGNSDMLAELRLWNQNMMTRAEVAELLNITERTLKTLPLRQYMVPEKTLTGIKEAWCYQLPEFVAFLQSLTPSYADYCPLEGPLLSPEQVASLAQEHGVEVNTRRLATLRQQYSGPISVAVGPRAHRYRTRDVLLWLQGQTPEIDIADLIMRWQSK